MSDWRSERDEIAGGWLEHEQARIDWEAQRDIDLGYRHPPTPAELADARKAHAEYLAFKNLEAESIEAMKRQDRDWWFHNVRDAS